MSSPQRSPLVDLTHPISNGLVTDPRLPPPRVYDIWTREQSSPRYAPGVSFQISGIDLCQNTGTYMDTPWHRHDSMAGSWNFPLERTTNLPGLRIDVRHAGRRLSGTLFDRYDFTGHAVLLWTGADARWGEASYRDGSHPFLTPEAARRLVDGGASLFGFDSLNADDFADLARPAHSILLGAAIPIVENLTNLGSLPERGFRFHAAPLPIVGFGSCPVRAYGILERGAGSA